MSRRGENIYKRRDKRWEGRFTLTFTRSEKEDAVEKEYHEYFVKAQYYTNGDLDGETELVFERVEIIPTLSEIEERYRDSVFFDEKEYEFTSTSIAEGGYILRFDRAYIIDVPEPPQTGDDSRAPLWIALASVSLLAIVILSFILMKKKEN